MTWLIAPGILLSLNAGAADLHVHHKAGHDRNSGAMDAPFATIQKAIQVSQEGDTVHLHPKGAVYRQSVTLRGKTGITIEGNDVTLDGSDPLPAQGWEELGAALVRLRLPQTTWNRHLLTFNGRVERMGRTQSSNSPKFPDPGELKEGQFCFVNGSDKSKTGWLYLRGGVKNLEWSVRPNGLATAGTNSMIVVRNLNARRFLNDGFNIHGRSVGLQFENIRGYDCFDEGFSAHDTCEAEIHGGKFWGNENGIADVNDCITHYRDCEFRDNVNVDALLIGKRHSLTDCQIINTTRATALSAGPRGEGQTGFSLMLTRLNVTGILPNHPARFRVNGGDLIMKNCRLENAAFNVAGSQASFTNVQVNGDTVSGDQGR